MNATLCPVGTFIMAVFAIGAALLIMGQLFAPQMLNYRSLWRAYAQEFIVVGALVVPLIIGGWVFYVALALFAARAFIELYDLFNKQIFFPRLLQTLIIFLPFVGFGLSVIGVLHYDFGWALILFVYVVVELNDAAAYMAGKFFGKRHIFPKLSPGKTLEGLCTGIIAGIVGGVTYAVFVLREGLSLELVIVSFAVLAGGLGGDMLTSYVKRRRGAKDFKVVLPGQGGVLDIFDAFLGGALALGLALAVPSLKAVFG